MASHTSRGLLSLGRISASALGLQRPLSRVTYATNVSTNYSAGKTGLPDRGAGKFARRPRRAPGEPRTEKMPVDQDWTAVYPAAAPFRPGSVPLPVRMGYPVKRGVPPEKKGNLELIKIPNFLHLTPAAIKKHCEALKPFCTEWPSALDTDARCDAHFPIKAESTDYVSAGPSVRNPAARTVHLKVKLSSLNLDDHAFKKMLKLVGERYCRDTDTLTITADRCPLRQQNHDHAMYLLTVLYHESWFKTTLLAVRDVDTCVALYSIFRKRSRGRPRRAWRTWRSTAGRTVRPKGTSWTRWYPWKRPGREEEEARRCESSCWAEGRCRSTRTVSPG
ncbi:small ribosomal subunit protein mS35 isoform X2 [Gasterosteus aculeatus]